MKNNNQKTIVLVGGGTGGHVSPTFEVYSKLKESLPEVKIIIVGTGGEIEKRVYKNIKNYIIIRSGKLIRRLTVANLYQFYLFSTALLRSYLLLKKSHPVTIFSKGGYASLPVLKAARFLKIPYYIHESDTEMGLANKLSAKGARAVFVGFPETFFPKEFHSQYVGQIINYNQDKEKERKYQFSNNKKTILITGGSQGSKKINQTIGSIAENLLSRYNIIHQTGIDNYKETMELKNKLRKDLQEGYKVFDFMDFGDLPYAIAVSDLVIARSGATTIGELSILKKPSILIPYKYAAGDHQLKNAKFLEEQEAVKIITDDDLNSDSLTESIEEIINDTELQKKLSTNIAKAIKTNGLEIIVKKLISEMENK